MSKVIRTRIGFASPRSAIGLKTNYPTCHPITGKTKTNRHMFSRASRRLRVFP